MNETAGFLFFEELPVRKAFKRTPMDLLVFSRLTHRSDVIETER